MDEHRAVETVRIFDTTLRDGEQSPGASLSPEEKVDVARQLDGMGVDVIEAGFPAASPGDLRAVQDVARVTERAEVAALARCTRGDVDAALRGLAEAVSPVLHVFVATSDIHLRYKLQKTRAQVQAQIEEIVSYARGRVARIEFSAEDATRSDWDFLVQVCQTAIEAGATTINLPDTVGYTVPDEYAQLFSYVRERCGGAEIVLSAHCHNDLGLATANSLAAIEAGARQVEVTVNGLGERAGNAALEEVVMALTTRAGRFGGVRTNIATQNLVPVSRLVSGLTGLEVQVNKAIVGANAFAHEAGIHQDGVIKERSTYEIMKPTDVGWEDSQLVLGKHSGRHGVSHRLSQLGFRFDGPDLDTVYTRFLELADRVKRVDDEQLRGIAVGVLATAGAVSLSRPA